MISSCVQRPEDSSALNPAEETTPIPTPSSLPTSVPSSKPSKPLSIADVVAKVSPAVVQIITDEGSGSGIVIDTAGHVLTNNHVVEKSSSATIVFKDGRKIVAKTASRDWFLDLAVLKIPDGNFIAATLGDSDQAQLGEEVVALGFPSGLGGSVTITRGIISAFRNPYLQTDAAVNPGSSGGPLVNMQGEVIGIITYKPLLAQKELAEGIGFAIAINEVKQSLSDLMTLSSQELGRLTTPPSTEEIPGIYGLLSIDSLGNIHYVWSEPAEIGGEPKVMYSMKQAHGTWTTPEVIFVGTKSTMTEPSYISIEGVVTDHDDVVHVIWVRSDKVAKPVSEVLGHQISTMVPREDLFYTNKALAKGWAEPKLISNGGSVTFADLAIDNIGTLHLVYDEVGISYLFRPKQGEWSEPVTIPNTDKVLGNTVLNLKCDNNDNLYLTYYLENNIYLSEKVGNSPWTLPESISNPGKQSAFPDIVIDYNNALHLILWERPGRIVYRSRGTNGAWSRQEYLSDIDHICSTGELGIGTDGTVYAAWTQQQNVEDKGASLLVRWKTRDGSWSPPYFVDVGHGRFLSLKSFAVDRNGQIHMLVVDEMKPGEHVSRYITCETP